MLAKEVGATTVETRKSSVHNKRPAPKGCFWLEFLVTKGKLKSVVAMPLPKGTSDEDIARFRKTFIEELHNVNPTVKTR